MAEAMVVVEEVEEDTGAATEVEEGDMEEVKDTVDTTLDSLVDSEATLAGSVVEDTAGRKMAEATNNPGITSNSFMQMLNLFFKLFYGNK